MLKLIGSVLMLVSSYELNITGDLYFAQALAIGLGIFFSESLVAFSIKTKESASESELPSLCRQLSKQ
jgi:hypothetical protein